MSFSLLVVEARAVDPPILPGATVVFDKPGGERVEATVGPDGIATIPSVDWSKGKASFTIVAEKHSLASLVEFDLDYVNGRGAQYTPKVPGNPKHDLAFYTLPLESAFKKVSGSVSVLQGTRITVSPTIAGTLYDDAAGSQYSMTVDPGKPFSLVAVDYASGGPAVVGKRGLQNTAKRFASLDHAATSADVTVDLAFDTMAPLTSKKVTGHMTIAGGAAGPLGGSSVAIGQVHGIGALLCSVLTRSDVNADASAFDYELEYVEPPGTSPYRTFIILQPNNGPSSTVTKVGWPVDGETIDGFIAPPPTKETTHPLSQAFDVDYPNIPDDGELRLVLADTREQRWFIQAPHGVKSFKAPVLTDAMRIALSARANSAAMIVLSSAEPAIGLYTKASKSTGFYVSY